MVNIWVDLHQLLTNNVKYEMGDYGRVSTNNYVIKGDDFKNRFFHVQILMRILHMAPSAKVNIRSSLRLNYP